MIPMRIVLDTIGAMRMDTELGTVKRWSMMITQIIFRTDMIPTP
jgi:hypothetical protein